MVGLVFADLRQNPTEIQPQAAALERLVQTMLPHCACSSVLLHCPGSWLSRHLLPRHMLPWQLHALRLARKSFTCDMSRLARLHCTIGAGQDVHVTGVDVNSAMAAYARDAAGAAGLPPERLRLLTGDVQALPFGDGSFDVVVCTLVGAPHGLRPLTGWTKAHARVCT